jgi:3-isopropylmalate/(R)-2-methylmalate dehydratase small subunit
LPAIEFNTDGIEEGDELEVNLDSGTVKNLTKGTETKFSPIPPTMQVLLSDGGLVEHFKKHGGFKL